MSNIEKIQKMVKENKLLKYHQEDLINVMIVVNLFLKQLTKIHIIECKGVIIVK